MRLHLLGNLPFFKIHVNHFMAQFNSPGANAEGGNGQSWTPSEARLRTLGYTHGHPPNRL